FKAQLTNIKGTVPDAIYVPGYYTDIGLIARQAREAGITAPLLGGDGWDSEKLYEIGGQAIEGSYFSNHYSIDDPSPRIQEFVAKLQPQGVPDEPVPPPGPKKTEGNTAPNAAPGMMPTPTQQPAMGAQTSAATAAATGQRQGVPSAEHPKK